MGRQVNASRNVRLSGLRHLAMETQASKTTRVGQGALCHHPHPAAQPQGNPHQPVMPMMVSAGMLPVGPHQHAHPAGIGGPASVQRKRLSKRGLQVTQHRSCSDRLLRASPRSHSGAKQSMVNGQRPKSPNFYWVNCGNGNIQSANKV